LPLTVGDGAKLRGGTLWVPGPPTDVRCLPIAM
jgi:hypothetical protein